MVFKTALLFVAICLALSTAKPSAKCIADNQSCDQYSNCCSKTCYEGFCQGNTTTTTTTTPTPCVQSGGSCTLGSHCCEGSCNSGVCGPTPECVKAGEWCGPIVTGRGFRRTYDFLECCNGKECLESHNVPKRFKCGTPCDDDCDYIS